MAENPAPTVIPGEGQAPTKIRAELDKLFPHGVMDPDFVMRRAQPPVDNAATAITPPAPVPTPAPTPAPPSTSAIVIPSPVSLPKPPTGPTGTPQPAATGPTGATQPAATGPTGAPEPAATGPTGPTPAEKLTKAALDKAEEMMTVKAGSAFKAVRGDLAIAEGKIKALEAERDDFRKKATAVDASKVTEMEETIKRYEDELSVTRVEATDDFKKRITSPLKTAQNALTALAKKYEIAPGDLQAALSDPDPNKRSDKLAELSANFNRLDINRFDHLLSEQDRLLELKQSTIDGAAGKFAEMQKAREAAEKSQTAKFHEDWVTALDASYNKLSTDLPVFKKTGDEGWDKMVVDAHERVQSVDVASLSNEELATRFYKAEVFPLLLNMVSDLHQKNVTLDDQLTKLRGGTPAAGAGNVPEEIPQPTAYKTAAEMLKAKLEGVLPK